jgi:hypothetical protein
MTIWRSKDRCCRALSCEFFNGEPFSRQALQRNICKKFISVVNLSWNSCVSSKLSRLRGGWFPARTCPSRIVTRMIAVDRIVWRYLVRRLWHFFTTFFYHKTNAVLFILGPILKKTERDAHGAVNDLPRSIDKMRHVPEEWTMAKFQRDSIIQ